MKYGTGDNIRQKFTGYQRDEETGLDFAEARYYNNNHGRFTAVDPLLASGKSANPQTFNRYAYTMNRPLILSDPTGLQAATDPNQRPLTPQEIVENRRVVDQVNRVSGANFSQRDLTRVNASIDNAIRMVAAPTGEGAINPCREALITNFGVANPTAALEGARTTGGAYTLNESGQPIQGTQNVFDGRVSENPVGPADNQTTVRAYLDDRPTVSAIATRNDGNVYIDNSFYDRNDVQRAQDIIHERVAHIGGNRDDASFAPQAEQVRQIRGETEAARAERLRTAGSRRINEIIQTDCPTIPRQN